MWGKIEKPVSPCVNCKDFVKGRPCPRDCKKLAEYKDQRDKVPPGVFASYGDYVWEQRTKVKKIQKSKNKSGRS